METDATLAAGTRVARCRIVRLIATGGQGSVYVARHETLDKDVAVKILSPSLAADPDFVRRFVREARAAAKLDHPNIIQIYDAGSENNVHYIVMQHVDGKDLDTILEKKGKAEVKDALSVAKRVALALGAAHKAGIVHRDIKPSNIMVTRQGKILVMDFGLARDTSATVSGSITQGEFVMGTPDFLSPEQAMGERADSRSDIYSLGATLYRMLAGQPPYPEGDAMTVMMKHARENEHPAPLRTLNIEVPPALEALVSKMMAKNPAERYQTMEEVVAAIDAIKGERVTSRAETAPPRRRVWTYVVAGMAIGIAGIILLAVLLRPDPHLQRLTEIERAYPTRPFAVCAGEIREVLDRKPPARVQDRASNLFLSLSRREIMTRARHLVALARARSIDDIVQMLDPDIVKSAGTAASRAAVRSVLGLADPYQYADLTLHDDRLTVDPEKGRGELPSTVAVQRKNGKIDQSELMLHWKLTANEWYLDTREKR